MIFGPLSINSRIGPSRLCLHGPGERIGWYQIILEALSHWQYTSWHSPVIGLKIQMHCLRYYNMAFRILNDITRWNSRSRRYGCCFRVPGVPGPEAESTHRCTHRRRADTWLFRFNVKLKFRLRPSLLLNSHQRLLKAKWFSPASLTEISHYSN